MTRILPREEYPRLVGTLSAQAWPSLPEGARVIVVEEDGRIVGSVAMFQEWHVEGADIAPSHRGRVSVGRRLLRAVRAAVADVGAREVLMMAVTGEGRRLCEGVGHATHLDCVHYAVRMT